MKDLTRLSMLVFMLLHFLSSYSQDSRTITGTVVDDSGQPAAFISVQLQGTSVQTQSDEGGVFSITIPAGAQTLVFSGIGYVSLTRAVAPNESNIRVQVAGSVEKGRWAMRTPSAASISSTVVATSGLYD